MYGRTKVKRWQMVVVKNRIFSTPKILFKANMYIWYLQVLNVQILTQQMDEPRLNMPCFFFFSRVGPIMTLTKGYIFSLEWVNFLKWVGFCLQNMKCLWKMLSRALSLRVPLWNFIFWFGLNTWSHPITSSVTSADDFHQVVRGLGGNLQVVYIWFSVFLFWGWWRNLLSYEQGTLNNGISRCFQN